MTIHDEAIELSPLLYPDSDGQPMGENTKQFNLIALIKENLEALFAEQPDVFIAGDLFWYPLEGRVNIRRAPDAMVVFGRPKGDRGSYKQWEEDNTAPQVVFEIISPGNTVKEMQHKLEFYTTYGVEEYYAYDPDDETLSGWIRTTTGELEPIAHAPNLNGWISPRLGIRFDMPIHRSLTIYRPDGEPFKPLTVLFDERNQARRERQILALRLQQEQEQREAAEQRAQREQQEREAAEQRAQREQQEREAAEQRAQREQQEREAAEQRAQREQQEREAAEQRAQREQQERERLAALLRAMGVDPDQQA